MQSLERIEVLNQRLMEHYGCAWNNEAIFRIVWSEEQFEKQLCEYTEHGILLLYPEYREVPKYRQWIHNKYLLERLVAVPFMQQKELTTKVSYEPLYVYADKNDNALPPKWEITKFVIDSVLAAQTGDGSLAKYADKNEPPEAREERIATLQNELFGNETSTGDALAYKQGVGYTGPSKVTIN